MNVLAISAHPDDVEIACSGTLAKCVKRGDRVVVCHLSTGNLGHVIIPPDELTKIRAAEAERAGKMAGIEVIGGMFDDIDIYDNNKAARDKVIDVIRYANPDFIITHNPDDYMPDHTAVSRLVFDANFGTAAKTGAADDAGAIQFFAAAKTGAPRGKTAAFAEGPLIAAVKTKAAHRYTSARQSSNMLMSSAISVTPLRTSFLQLSHRLTMPPFSARVLSSSTGFPATTADLISSVMYMISCTAMRPL